MLHSAILQGPYLQGQLHQRKPGDASSSSHYTEPTVYQTSQEQLAVAHFLDRLNTTQSLNLIPMNQAQSLKMRG